MYGPVSMEIAQHWPVLTSYDHLVAYATSKGGRLPTENELRLFLDKYDVGHEGGANIGFRNWHPVPSVLSLVKIEPLLTPSLNQANGWPYRELWYGLERWRVGMVVHEAR